MTDITFKGVPEGIENRVKQLVLRVVAQEIQRTELKPTQDQVDKANAALNKFRTDNGITQTED